MIHQAPPRASAAARLKAAAGRWVASQAHRRLQKEIAEHDRPRVRLTPLFGRREASAQEFRSLVQINIYPRPR